MRSAAAAMLILLATLPAAAQSNPTGVYPFPPPSPPIMTNPSGRDLPVRIDPTDKATRCLQYAASIGVPRERLESYLRDCQMR
jgi:hypothetical protein